MKNYETEDCGNLYAFASERSLRLLNNSGGFGFIVPISLVGTQRMETMQKILIRSSKLVWLSNFAERPSKLFAGADVLLTILLSRAGRKGECALATTEFMKWTSDERFHLFHRITYHFAVEKVKPHVIPKLCSNTEAGPFNCRFLVSYFSQVLIFSDKQKSRDFSRDFCYTSP